MSNLRFIFISAVIFLIIHLFSTFSVWLFLPSLFAIWVLIVYFCDQNNKIRPALLAGIIIFFDFWSGDRFGLLTLALWSVFLLSFLFKKIVLIDTRQPWSAVVWILIFYYFFLFLKTGFNLILKENFITPHFDLTGLVITILFIIVLARIFWHYEKKRVSGF